MWTLIVAMFSLCIIAASGIIYILFKINELDKTQNNDND